MKPSCWLQMHTQFIYLWKYLITKQTLWLSHRLVALRRSISMVFFRLSTVARTFLLVSGRLIHMSPLSATQKFDNDFFCWFLSSTQLPTMDRNQIKTLSRTQQKLKNQTEKKSFFSSVVVPSLTIATYHFRFAINVSSFQLTRDEFSESTVD